MRRRSRVVFLGLVLVLAAIHGGDQASAYCVGNWCLDCDINQQCVQVYEWKFCTCRTYSSGCAAWTQCQYVP